LWTAPLGEPAGTTVDWFSGPTIVFWIIALLTVAGAISTVTRRNNIAAVMSLVATFFGLAALYAMLSAHFLAALQVLVYAGAIMVLFIFVVMVLNRDESEPWAARGLVTKAIGVAALGYLLAVVGIHLNKVQAVHPDAPSPDFGTVADVGNLLFTDYLFAFEAVSILLMIAVVAAVVLAKPRHAPPHPTSDSGTPPTGDGHAAAEDHS
jgi:NADH-quinone oxidoreductase subunit J